MINLTANQQNNLLLCAIRLYLQEHLRCTHISQSRSKLDQIDVILSWEMTQMRNHYETLGLPQRQFDINLTGQDIKQAYRRALLQHHPDKATEAEAAETVDAITLAYKTLSEPGSRTEYDRQLRLSLARNKGEDKVSYTGLDIVDLDDLEFDDEKSVWWRSCRCGQERGFIVTEDELEKEARFGELVTGCRGCSLWLKVLFGVEEDEGDNTNVAQERA